MELKFRGNLFTLAAASAAYGAAIPFLPCHVAFLWVTGALIVVNFVLSMRQLIRRGHLSWDLVLLNLVQLVLFGCLHVWIHDVLGAHHYAYAAPPTWYHWAQFIAVHVLRAVDILDGIDAYGISLQRIRNATAFSGTVLVSMHIVVDAFLFGALLQFVRRQGAIMKGARILRNGWKSFCRVLNPFDDHGAAGQFFFWLIWALFPAALAVVCGWTFKSSILWLSDNVLRAVDIGDAFQIFGWRLHNVDMGPNLAPLAVVVRLVAACYLTPLLVRGFLCATRGRELSVDALLQIVKSKGFSYEERSIAVRTLTAKSFEAGPVVSVLAGLLADGDWSVRKAAADALACIDPEWARSQSAREALPGLVKSLANEDLKVRMAAAEVLTSVDPDWQKSQSAKEAIPALVKSLGSWDRGVRQNAAGALGLIGPVAAPAVPALSKLLVDEEILVRRSAAWALDKIDPEHRLHQH
jgi:hypothetical protein